MIPNIEIEDFEFDEADIKTSKSYRFDGLDLIDGYEALRQSIEKMLLTQQYDFPIYSFDYGVDFESYIGKDPSYVEVELPRVIKEALLEDDRINDVTEFLTNTKGDSLFLEFTVESIFGDIQISKEVTV